MGEGFKCFLGRVKNRADKQTAERKRDPGDATLWIFFYAYMKMLYTLELYSGSFLVEKNYLTYPL